MRIAWLPRLLIVLGVLGGGLLWLVPRFGSLLEGDSPWTPPEPAVAGLPAAPMQALHALAVHGAIPECRAHVEEADDDEVHEHRIVPVEPLSRLEGQAEKIRPYLGHPSELVVYRAASLLCFIQDRPSKRALEWLDSRYPCRRWVGQIMAGAGLRPDAGFMPRRQTAETSRTANCQEGHPKGGYELLSSLPHQGSSPSPEALALARRISEGDASAVHEALQTTQAMEFARRPDGGHALMRVSTPRGLALVYQALLERWDAEVLSYSSVWHDHRQEWKDGLLEGVGLEALRTVAAYTGKTKEAVLVETVGLMPESLMEPTYAAVAQSDSFSSDIARLARSPEGDLVTSATARAFMERLEREDTQRRARKLEAASKRITAFYRAEDRTSLRMAAMVPMPTPFQQALAGCYLLALGEKEELPLFTLEQFERSRRMTIPDRNAIRSEVKRVLDQAKPGATKKHLQRIYERLSEHCQREDCSVESPR
jgi:hypothetical protein